MFDLFGIKKLEEYEKNKRNKSEELKELAYKIISDSNNFMLKSGIISKADYWKNKLDLDIKRYNL